MEGVSSKGPFKMGRLSALRRALLLRRSSFRINIRGRHGGLEKRGGWKTSRMIRVAHLQSEFCTKDFFFRPRIFLRKMLRNFPEIFEPLFCGSEKNPRKIPSKFPTTFSKFPCEKSKKNHRRASAGAQGERMTPLPKVRFKTPLVRYAFHPPQVSALCLSCTKIHDRADQKLFWRGPKIFGRARSLVRFPPPKRFAPPHITAQQYATPNLQVCRFCFLSLVQKEKCLLRKPDSPY